MAQVESRVPEDGAHKSLLEQETEYLEAEFQKYEEKVHEFSRANSETLDWIYKEVNKSDTFVVQDVPRPATEQVVKYVVRDDMKPDILISDTTIELFEIWSDTPLNWF